jgi:hypothetical protein
LVLPVVWLCVVFVGFTALLWAAEDQGLAPATLLSGSALFTLGFERPVGAMATTLAFMEAGTGLILIALLIAYLPVIYGSFSRRELMVTQLAVRSGTPPTGWLLLERAALAGYLDEVDAYFTEWERWFVELQETHTSLGAVVYLRSPHANRSWVTSAGAVLDAAALRMSVVDMPFSAAGAICIRAGFLSLQAIATTFGVPFEPDPHPTDPIAIDRSEFDLVCTRMEVAGVPLLADRDQAWRDFAGWRVNYDTVLLSLAGMTMAPYSPWSSDRSPINRGVHSGPHRPPVRRRRGRRNTEPV